MVGDIIGCIKKFYENDPKVLLVILFGSYATGRSHSGSDIDIAVAYPDRLSLDERVSKAQALSVEINKEVDLVDLRDAQGVLLQQILAHRKTLINRDSELYGNIIARRINEEEDLMPLFNQILKARRERFISGSKGYTPKA